MSTVTHEPQLGQPQTSAGAELLQHAQPQMGQMPQPGMGQMPQQGMPTQPGMGQMPQQGMPTQPGMGQMPAQPGMGQMPAQPGMGQMPQQVEQIDLTQGQIGNIENIPNPNLTPNMVPQSQQVNEFPTIPDNNPVATLPENTNTGILEQGQMPQPGMPAQPQMGQMPQQGMGQMPQQGMPAQPQMGQMPQQSMGQMPQQGMPAQPQMGQMPQQSMQQMNHQGMNQFNQTQYQPQGQPQQQIPGSTAPGFNNGSYLQQQGGMFGPTPTGHPEKQKFQAQFTLVYAKAKTSSKGTIYTSGLIANPTDRNAPAINFMCFSTGATKQIQILDDAQSKSMYTNIEKAGGQPIWVEASWQWNDKNKNQPPAWQLMCDNLIFINDQNFRQTAENWVPPVPPSPMDMLAGGNMQIQQMMGQMPQQGMGQMPQQGMGQMQQMMGQMPQPQMGQMPQQGMGQMQQMMGQMPQPQMGQMPQQGMPGMV